MPGNSETPRKPGRPRSQEAHQAILEATLVLLAEVGFQGLSIEQVAARAGVGKVTLYRRWATKELLVSDAIRSIQAEMPVIDSGNIRDDLIAMYRTALQGLESNPLIRPLYLRLLSEWSSQGQVFQVFLSQLILPRFQQFVELVRKAQARNEIRHDIKLDIVLDLLIGPVLFRWLSTNVLTSNPASSYSEDIIEEIADLVLRVLSKHP